MAYIGLRKPFIAAMNDDGKYGKKEQFAKAISLEITPNYAEGSLYADDGLAEYDKEFTNADVTLGTNTLPIEMQNIMFGHEVNEDDVTHKKDDESAYVGFGIIEVQKVNNVRYFIGAFLPKVKFTEPSESFETKGESITYKTPSITGKATANDEGVWKKTKTFDNEAAAILWIEEQFGEEQTTE